MDTKWTPKREGSNQGPDAVTIKKSDLVIALAKELDLRQRKAEEIVDKAFDTMSKALISGNRIEIRGFGAFTVKNYRGYSGRNPRTGEKISVKAKRLPFFKMSKGLSERVNHESIPVEVIAPARR